MWHLGSATLDKAVTVKLTRTLAIIPITLVLAAKKSGAKNKGEGFRFRKVFPLFILYFILAAIFTTICVHAGVQAEVFMPLKTISKFFIVMAMVAIGLNSDIVKLIRTGGKPLLIGASCWVGITLVSLAMQHMMHIW